MFQRLSAYSSFPRRRRNVSLESQVPILVAVGQRAHAEVACKLFRARFLSVL